MIPTFRRRELRIPLAFQRPLPRHIKRGIVHAVIANFVAAATLVDYLQGSGDRHTLGGLVVVAGFAVLSIARFRDPQMRVRWSSHLAYVLIAAGIGLSHFQPR